MLKEMFKKLSYILRVPVCCFGDVFGMLVLMSKDAEYGGSVLNSTLLEGLFGVDVLFPLLAVMLDFCTRHGFGFELLA
jgi:hypothetical protein